MNKNEAIREVKNLQSEIEFVKEESEAKIKELRKLAESVGFRSSCSDDSDYMEKLQWWLRDNRRVYIHNKSINSYKEFKELSGVGLGEVVISYNYNSDMTRAKNNEAILTEAVNHLILTNRLIN